MAYLNRGNNSRGGRDFGRRDSDQRSSEPRQKFPAVCSNCGKDCEVPFRPSGDKPVFCSDCFGKNQRSDSGRSESRFSPRPRYDDRRDSDNRAPAQADYKEQFVQLNNKLDKVLKLLNTTVPVSPAQPKTVQVEVTAASESENQTETPPKKIRAAKKTSDTVSA